MAKKTESGVWEEAGADVWEEASTDIFAEVGPCAFSSGRVGTAIWGAAIWRVRERQFGESRSGDREEGTSIIGGGGWERRLLYAEKLLSY